MPGVTQAVAPQVDSVACCIEPSSTGPFSPGFPSTWCPARARQPRNRPPVRREPSRRTDQTKTNRPLSGLGPSEANRTRSKPMRFGGTVDCRWAECSDAHPPDHDAARLGTPDRRHHRSGPSPAGLAHPAQAERRRTPVLSSRTSDYQGSARARQTRRGDRPAAEGRGPLELRAESAAFGDVQFGVIGKSLRNAIIFVSTGSWPLIAKACEMRKKLKLIYFFWRNSWLHRQQRAYRGLHGRDERLGSHAQSVLVY